MKCPKCGRFMEKVYSMSNLFHYKCVHCGYESEFLTGNNKPFGDNYPAFPDYDDTLHEWRFKKKWDKMLELKKEHKKILKDMYKKLGKITDDDEAELLIWLWEYGKRKEK